MSTNFKILLLSLFSLAMVAGLSAQCPGPAQRQALINLQKANVAETTRAGQIPLTDTCGNQRYAQYVEINLTPINYIPTTTGNANNLSEFVVSSVDTGLYYIDWQGRAIRFSGTGGGGTCDVDWLEIGPNTCPDAINDSIYTYKYAAVGARYVWPTAEFLVNDSTATAVQVISGSRNSRLVFYDNTNVKYSTIDQSGASTLWYLQPSGTEFRILTAGGGTPQAPGAPFVNQFAVNPSATPLPTIQAHQYPRTRTDTASVYNFLYTDGTGNFRSQSIDTLIQIIYDSLQIDTALAVNWYTTNGTTTDLGRTALVKRTALWLGVDTVGFLRHQVGLLDGARSTVFQDSVTLLRFGSTYTNYVTVGDSSINIATSGPNPQAVNVGTDTINWRSTADATLQTHNLLPDGTHFNADSLKTVAIGQFPAFPALTFTGTTKGFYYEPSDAVNNVSMINGTYSPFTFVSRNANDDRAYDYALNSTASALFSMYPHTANIVVNNSTSSWGTEELKIISTGATTDGLSFVQGAKAGNTIAFFGLDGQAAGTRGFYIGSAYGGLSNYFHIQVDINNDSLNNGIGFYNGSYFFPNDRPSNTIGDTTIIAWVGNGTNAGKNPILMPIPSGGGGTGDVNQGGNSFGAPMVIGTNDDNTFSLETNGVTRSTITTGASTGGQWTMTNVTANTNTVSDILTLQTNSTGTAANNFGSGILFQGESSTTDNRDMVRLSAIWTTATDASRFSALVYSDVVASGALTERFRFSGTSMTTNIAYTIGNSPNTLYLTSSAASNPGLVLNCTNNTATSDAGIMIGNALTFTQTSGTRNYINNNWSFAPTSGTAVHNQEVFSGTFNQTGGANGIIRGIYLNQTLTAVADFRAIEIAADEADAKGIYQTGSNTKNTFVGATGFGATTAPTDKVEITGNLALLVAGNKLKIATGADASVGTSAAMTAGSITISTTAVTANSQIFLTHASVGGTQGILSVGTITAGTSFVINSSNAADTGTVNWLIIN